MYLHVGQFRTQELLFMWKSGIFPWIVRESGNIHTVSHKLSRVTLPLRKNKMCWTWQVALKDK